MLLPSPAWQALASGTAPCNCLPLALSFNPSAPAAVNGVTQKPIEGVSMKYTFTNAKAPSTRKTQYFEMFCNSAIYHDGWVACTTPPTPPWSPAGSDKDFITEY